jgi:hypothetical protein
LSLLNRI